MEIWSDLFLPGVPVLEKIVRPIVIYLFLVVILRLLGQRALAQMNPFDLVVLLTISNTVQNAIIGNDNSLLGGMIGAATLILVNLAVLRYLYRHQRLDRAIEGHPVTLIEHGMVLEANLAQTLITHDELMAAVRHQGVARVEDVERAILETSGTISVFSRQRDHDADLTPVLERLDRIERLLAGQSGPEGRA